MKVLYFTSLFWPDLGGMETLALNTLPPLQERGFEFRVIAGVGGRSEAGVTSYEGIPIYRFPIRECLSNRDLKSIMGIRKSITELKNDFRPELIHINFGGYPSSYFHTLTQTISPAPMLLTMHISAANMDMNRNTLLGKLLYGAERVIGVSKAITEDILAQLPEFRERVAVIYNGVPVPPISPTPLPQKPPVILGFGRLIKEKGFDLAITAFSKLLSHYPAARLLIVGEGPEMPALHEQIGSLGLGKQVDLLGGISPERIPSIINQSTVVVIPSRWREPFSLVAVEAAMMGRPVVASRVGGLVETVEDQVTGILVNNESSEDLYKGLMDVLEDSEKGQHLGIAGRKRAQSLFSMTNFIDAYEKIYREMGEVPTS